MIRWRTRLLAGCGTAVAAVLGVAGLAVVLLGTRAGNAWLLARALAAAGGRLPGARIEAADLRTDVVSTLVVTDARLLALDGRELAGVDRILVRWSAAALLAGEVRVRVVEVDRPRVAVGVLPDGRLDLVEALGLTGPSTPGEGGWQGPPLPVRVDALRLQDGAFTWTGPDGAFAVEDLDVQADLALEGRDVRVGGLALGARLRPTGTEPLPIALGGALALVDGDLEVGPLAARAAGVEVRLSGRVEDVETEPRLALALLVRDLDPAALQRFVGDLGIAGPIGLHADVYGPLRALAGRAVATTPGGRIRAGFGLDLEATPIPWNLVLELDDVVPERVVAGFPEGTRLRGRVRVGGVGLGAGLRTTAEVALGPSTVAGVAFDAFDARVDQEGTRLSLHDAAVRAALGEVRAEGTVGLDTGAVDLALDASRLDLARLSAFGVTGLAGTAAASGRVRWTADAGLRVDGSFAAAAVEAGGVRVERLTGAASWSGDRLEVALDARSADDRSMAVVAGELDLATGAIRAETLAFAPIDGVAWANEGLVRLTLTEGGFRDLEAVLASGDARIRLRGDLDAAGPVDLEVHAADVALAPLAPLLPDLPPDLAGRVQVDVRLQGTPEALTASGTASVEDLAVPGAVRSLDADLALEAASGGLDLALDVPDAAGQRFLRVEGRLPLTLSTGGAALDPDAPWRLDVQLAPGGLDRLAALLEMPALPDGVASAHLEVGGTPGAPTTALGGALEAVLGEGGERLRVELTAHQDGDRLALEASLARDFVTRATVTGQARTRLPEVARALLGGEAGPDPGAPGTWVSDLDVALVPLDLPLAALRPLLPGLPEGLEGQVRGSLRVLGEPAAPRIEGGLQLAGARLGDVPLDYPTVEIVPEGRGYRVDAAIGFGERGKDGGVTLAGHVPAVLSLDGAALAASLEAPGLALEVGGAGVPLGVLGALSASLGDPAGRVRLTGRVGGSLAAPDPHLVLTLEDGAVTARDLAVRFEDVQIEAALEGERLEVRRLEATSAPLRGGGRGTLSLQGSASFDAWRPELVAVQGDMRAFRLADRPDARVALTGWIAVSGLWPGLRVKGQLAADEVRFAAGTSFWLGDRALALDPRIVLRRQAPATAPPGPPWYQAVSADVDIDLRKSAWVDIQMPLDDRFGKLYASLARVDLVGQLDGTLVLDLADGVPSLVGEVEPVRGRAQILGALFEMKPGGRVAFTGRDVLDPMLRIDAVHDAGEWGAIDVAIGGSLDAMTLAFSSADWPDETDIASILVLGRPLSEASGGAGESNALALASGVLAGELERTLGGLDVDMLRIDAASTGGIGAAQVGQSIGRKLFLTMAWRPQADPMQGENTLEATLEWTIAHAWTVEVRSGDQGASSADLFRTWRF